MTQESPIEVPIHISTDLSINGDTLSIDALPSEFKFSGDLCDKVAKKVDSHYSHYGLDVDASQVSVDYFNSWKLIVDELHSLHKRPVDDIIASIQSLAQRVLHESGLTWGDTGEFGDAVRLIEKMLREEAQPPEPREVAILRSVARPEFLHAIEIVGQHLQQERIPVDYAESGGAASSLKTVYVPECDRTIAACCEQVSRTTGSDPSQIVFDVGGNQVNRLQDATAEAIDLEASRTAKIWKQVVQTWRDGRRGDAGVDELVAFIESLSQRAMPGSSDGTWSTAGAFGGLVQNICSLLDNEDVRGGVSNTGGDVCEVCALLRAAAANGAATIESFEQALRDEFEIALWGVQC